MEQFDSKKYFEAKDYLRSQRKAQAHLKVIAKSCGVVGGLFLTAMIWYQLVGFAPLLIDLLIQLAFAIVTFFTLAGLLHLCIYSALVKCHVWLTPADQVFTRRECYQILIADN